MTNEEADQPVELGGAPRLFIASVTDARDAAEAADWLAQRHPGWRFVGVLSNDLHDQLGPALTTLWKVVAELVFFDSLTPPHRTGADTAMHALDSLGVGQDFVFTVADLDDAIDYAIARTRPGDDARWEATAVLVVGPPPVVEVARRHGAGGRDGPRPATPQTGGRP